MREVGLEACRKDLGEYKDSKLRKINKEDVAILYRPKRQCKQDHMGPAGLYHMQPVTS